MTGGLEGAPSNQPGVTLTVFLNYCSDERGRANLGWMPAPLGSSCRGGGQAGARVRPVNNQNESLVG